MLRSSDRIFLTGMFFALAALTIMSNTQCPSWLRIVLFG